MAIRKVNDNGKPPACPVTPDAAGTIDDAVRQETEDAQLRDAQRAKKVGLCEAYTRAPWLIDGWDD